MPIDRVALATVTTDSFISGTLVMLYSFLKHNRWFAGDIVIIHGSLTHESRDYLSRVSERVSFLHIDPRLEARVDDVVQDAPRFSSVRAQFYSLETFRLKNHDRVLFCDSDLLFRRSIHELFELPHALVACGDGSYYKGEHREWAPDHNTFNSGFFLVDRHLLTDDNYSGLLHLVDRDLFRESPANHTDQRVLNIYFAGRQHLVSATYNYVLAHRAAVLSKEGVSITDAHVLHYNGPTKPWRPDQVLRASLEDPALIKAWEFWFDGYVECLQQLHLKSKLAK